MLRTPVMPVQGQPDCPDCQAFEKKVRDPGRGANWTADFQLPALHPGLDETVDTYGIPGSGYGLIKRCSRCGSLWNISLMCDHGWEDAGLEKCGTERRESFVHCGPWTGLVNLVGLRCAWNVDRFSIRLRTQVQRERIHEATRDVMQRYEFIGLGDRSDVGLKADLHCRLGEVGEEDGGESHLVSVRPLARASEERLSGAWWPSFMAKIEGRAGELGMRPDDLAQLRLQTLGAYRFEFEDRSFDVWVDHLCVAVGRLQYDSAHFLDEAGLDEEGILVLMALASGRVPVDRLGSLVGAGGSPRSGESVVPFLEVLPAQVNRARAGFAPRDFENWSRAILSAPGVHLFHCGPGDPDGRGKCPGQVMDQLRGTGVIEPRS